MAGVSVAANVAARESVRSIYASLLRSEIRAEFRSGSMIDRLVFDRQTQCHIVYRLAGFRNIAVPIFSGERGMTLLV